MIRTIKIVKHQGKQFIRDLQNVNLPDLHTGKPVISGDPCKPDCRSCKEICPVQAISTQPVSIDMGRCVFCRECIVCPEKIISFSNEYKIASNEPGLLKVHSRTGAITFNPDLIRDEIHRMFGGSLKLRLVSDGSCNGCELELNASDNVNFDMSRYGIEFVASPRHADGVVVTGALVENSIRALELTYEAIPAPKIVIAVGACAISGGIFQSSKALNRSFFEKHKPDLYIPGCPPHPLTIIDGILKLTGRIK
ncbi:MAG TPA: NADH:ubiquinone oxidoreductase [Bacteroidales bacterium]|nr:NADH:ubiquinone oxidoreductase [Bacteroidales bacterium]